MSPGQAAADALLERHGRTPPPAGTAVAAVDLECARCGVTGTRLVPPYWAPDRPLCPGCCGDLADGFGDDERAWPTDGRWTPSSTRGAAA